MKIRDHIFKVVVPAIIVFGVAIATVHAMNMALPTPTGNGLRLVVGFLSMLSVFLCASYVIVFKREEKDRMMRYLKLAK